LKVKKKLNFGKKLMKNVQLNEQKKVIDLVEVVNAVDVENEEAVEVVVLVVKNENVIKVCFS
jgi:hypothetical protein